ncbi:hypothetical protein [Flavobacterium sp.]|uniref:hypothetical protein n=1 Tax=Flavobacterium sp. TaxID=239 RepID=UPI0039E6F46B
MNLREKLQDWTDTDVAIHHIAVELCLFQTDNFTGYQWVQWTENPYRDFLEGLLKQLLALGMLETDEDQERVRFNPDFGIHTTP